MYNKCRSYSYKIEMKTILASWRPCWSKLSRQMESASCDWIPVLKNWTHNQEQQLCSPWPSLSLNLQFYNWLVELYQEPKYNNVKVRQLLQRVSLYLNEPWTLDSIPPAVVTSDSGVCHQEVCEEWSLVGGKTVGAGPGHLDTGSGVHLASLTRLQEEQLGLAC